MAERKPGWIVPSIASAVALIGAVALAGWVLDVDLLKAMAPGQPPMKANTALCLLLAGGALAAAGGSAPGPRIAAMAAALAILAVALATLVEHGTGMDLGIDEGRLGRGRMAVASAVGLGLAAVALLLVTRAERHPAAGRVARGLAAAVATIGAVDLLGLPFKAVLLYTWYAFGAVSTSVALLLLGAGLLAAGRRGAWAPRPLEENQRITQAAAFALILAAGATGVAGVGALESQVRGAAEGELRSLLDAQLADLTTNLSLRRGRAAIVTTRPNMLRHLRRLVADPANAESREVVQGVLYSFLGHDFSLLAVTLPGGEEIARAGDEGGPAALDVPLDGAGTARLIWRRDLALRHAFALADADGPLGAVVAEQRLPSVVRGLLGNATRFASAELLLCGRAAPAFRCFPSRLSPAPVVLAPGPSGSPRLAQRALTEGPGTGTTIDYRGQLVLGAFTPLPAFGLVAVLKVDVDEIYGPIRRQIALALLLVALFTVGGVALIRARVGPLAARLEARVQDRTADLDRVNARLRILHEIDRGLIAAQAPGAIAEAALGPLQELLRLPRAIVNLFDLETGEAEWLAAVGRRRLRSGPGVRFPLALMGDVAALRRGEVQVIDVDALPPSPEAQALLDSGVHVYRVVPMIAAGELIGGLSFGGARDELTAEQIDLAREVADQLAIVIAQARLHERVARQAEELEQRVQERTQELREANVRLEEEIAERRRAEAEAARANHAKSEFLSRMSHELRTPLNAILGFAQLLELEGLVGEQRESVEHIGRAGRHLLALIDEVLDISRIEAGRLRLSLEPVPLAETLRGALDLVRPLGQARGVELRAEGVPAHRHVLADRQRLHQVLLNLLSNGVKYTPRGGTVTVSCDAEAADRIRLRVADTGPGIAPEMLARLFTPFDRLGAEATGVEGTGLGLTLSRHLVEAMGGALGVDSRVGVGSTFSVELPVAATPLEVLPRPWVEAPAAASPAAAVILYIEDNLSNLRLVERILARRPGVRLLSAMQGRVGLDLAREHRPDLILLDQHLPDVAGDEVLRALLSDARTRDIPVVMLSADANPRQIQRLREAGARDYLTKPLDVKRFLALIDGTLGERGSA